MTNERPAQAEVATREELPAPVRLRALTEIAASAFPRRDRTARATQRSPRGCAICPPARSARSPARPSERAERRRRIVDPRRDARRDRAADQPIALEVAQRAGQHALRNAVDRAAQRVEPQRTTPPRLITTTHRPLVADARKHLGDGLAGRNAVLPRSHRCAYRTKILPSCAGAVVVSIWPLVINRNQGIPAMNILRIDSAVTGQESVSRELTQAIVDHFRALATRAPRSPSSTSPPIRCRTSTRSRPARSASRPTATTRRCAPSPPPSARCSTSSSLPTSSSSARRCITSPIPSQLKAWLDRLGVPGVTFSYSEAGRRGLAGGRKVIVPLDPGRRLRPRCAVRAPRELPARLSRVHRRDRSGVRPRRQDRLRAGSARMPQSLRRAR